MTRHITGFNPINSKFEPPILLSNFRLNVKSWIIFENGILNIEALIKGEKNHFFEHTPELFSTVKLPYPYNINANAPIWHKFLKQVVPDKEMRMLLQEWFGYNLVYDTSFNKFLILYGEGANGKSVICTVLMLILGEENVSAVGLEAFDPKRTFPLAATQGKLANIAEEIGEMHKAAEGLLKQFTGGKKITVEKKMRNPFDMTPTARLTFATNILPRFSDRSEGLWRRMIAFPLMFQILNESDQNKNLLNTDWWKDSGELPAILNWAIEGLQRLRQNGQFTKAKKSIDARDEYKKESNPARQFINENLKERTSSTLPTSIVYQVYQGWASRHGYSPLSQSQFSTELKRAFFKIKKSPNAIRLDNGSRGHVWIGLDWIDRDSVFIDLNGKTPERIRRKP